MVCGVPAPTPEELVARLMEVTGAKTEMQLAVALDVSIRTIQSWKAGKGISFPHTMMALDRAGWLCVDGDGAINRGQMRQMREELRQLRLLAEQLERRASP
jgi:hypothetical protein